MDVLKRGRACKKQDLTLSVELGSMEIVLDKDIGVGDR
jgi:hypothetical protein